MKSIILFYLVIIITFTSPGQTIIPGGFVSGTWGSSQSPYHIQGNIEIHYDSSLIIEPGVDVLFDGSYKLTVHGLLNASGTATDSILFTATDPAIGWQGIEFIQINESLGESTIKYCTLTHGKKTSGSGGAIYVYQSENVLISNCLIMNNYASNGGGIYINDGWIEISHCRITQNTASDYAGGIACFNSRPYFLDLEVTSNTSGYAGGIYFENCPTYSYPFFEDLIISNNIGGQVGGVALVAAPSLVLDGCKISNNQARMVGGIAILYGSLGYWGYPAEKNQVYMNKGGLAYDLYFEGAKADDYTIINIDTFTVINPDSYLVYPPDKFDFIDGIEYGIIEQADADLYISDAGNDANDGLTPESPLRSFEYALRKITSDSVNNTLWVLPGHYHLTESESSTPIYLKNDVKIKATVPGEAILDGDSTCRVFFGYYKNNFMLYGLTIQNGYMENALGAIWADQICGGGLYNVYSSGIINSCIFISNYSKYFGGGIYLDGNYNINISYCNFIQNTAESGGGGILSSNNSTGPLYINNCLFQGNHSGESGGGLAYSGNQINIKNTEFIENTSVASGAGFYCNVSAQIPGFVNCFFSKNIAEEKGGGIYIIGGTVAKLINCTFSDNQAASGSAICQIYLKWLYSINSIFWNTEVPTTDLIHVKSTGIPAVTGFYANYSDIQGGESSIVAESAGVHWQEGNLTSNPAFVDPENGDYTLNWNSSCIEAGQEDTTGFNLPATDLNGEPRIVNARIDMGAYEFQSPVIIHRAGQSDSPFRIYPVTEGNIIKIEVPQEFREDHLILKIFSSNGSEVKSLENFNGGCATEVDVSELSPGIYFLVLMNSLHVLNSGKFIIAR